MHRERHDSFNLFTSLNHSCILEVPKNLFFYEIIEMCTRDVCNNTIFYCVKIQKHSSCTKSRQRCSLKRVLLHNSGDNNINDNLKMLPGIHTNSVLFTFLLLLKYNYSSISEKEEFIWDYSPRGLRIHNIKKVARAGS